MEDRGRPETEPIAARRWKWVYGAVLAHLLLWIALLRLFSRWFGGNP